MKLELLEIPAPCSVPWESMTGDDRVRHCAHCHLDVYNLSSMTRADAERFLHEREGACVSFLKRHDGTVVTQDCAADRSATPTPCKTAPSAPQVHAAAPSKPSGDPPRPPDPAGPPRPPPPPIRLGGAPMPMPRPAAWETIDARVGRGTLLADLVRAIRAGLSPDDAEPAIREVERALELPSASWKTASCSAKSCPLWIPAGPETIPEHFLKPRTELLAKIDTPVRAAFDAERAETALREVRRIAFAGSRGACPHCHSWIGLPIGPPVAPPPAAAT